MAAHRPLEPWILVRVRAPLFFGTNPMKSDSSHSHPDNDTPDPHEPSFSHESLFDSFVMQAVCALNQSTREYLPGDTII